MCQCSCVMSDVQFKRVNDSEREDFHHILHCFSSDKGRPLQFCLFELADRQTDRHTHTHVIVFGLWDRSWFIRPEAKVDLSELESRLGPILSHQGNPPPWGNHRDIYPQHHYNLSWTYVKHRHLSYQWNFDHSSCFFVFFPKTGLVKTHLLFWLLFPPRLGVFGFCPASYTPLSPEVENKLIACRAETWLVGGVLVEPN